MVRFVAKIDLAKPWARMERPVHIEHTFSFRHPASITLLPPFAISRSMWSTPPPTPPRKGEGRTSEVTVRHRWLPLTLSLSP